MTALTVTASVLGGIALIVGIILSLPVKVMIKNGEEGLELRYKLLGKTFGEDPDPDSTVRKLAEQLTGLSTINTAGKLKAGASRRGAAAMAKQVLDILIMLLGRVVWILPRCRLKRLYVKAVCADSDAAEAAMDYGLACSVIYPAAGYLTTVMKTSEDDVKLDVTCGFDEQESSFDIDVVISVRILHVIRALLYIVKKNTEKEIYRVKNNG